MTASLNAVLVISLSSVRVRFVAGFVVDEIIVPAVRRVPSFPVQWIG